MVLSGTKISFLTYKALRDGYTDSQHTALLAVQDNRQVSDLLMLQLLNCTQCPSYHFIHPHTNVYVKTTLPRNMASLKSLYIKTSISSVYTSHIANQVKPPVSSVTSSPEQKENPYRRKSTPKQLILLFRIAQ